MGVVTCPHCGGAFQIPGEITIRELEILEHLAKGQENKEIARSLHISDQTVKNHITSIMKKLHTHNRVETVMAGLRADLIKL